MDRAGERIIVVSGYAYRGHGGDPQADLREETWGLALDQRAFGPRRLVVAFADDDGLMTSIGHTERIDPVEDALEACILHLGLGATYAVAFCDEMLELGPPPAGLAARFDDARTIAARWGVDLVDWISCDDELFRSSWMALRDDPPWWRVPVGM